MSVLGLRNAALWFWQSVIERDPGLNICEAMGRSFIGATAAREDARRALSTVLPLSQWPGTCGPDAVAALELAQEVPL